jgi:CSLREA domain-containing protein
MKGEGKGFPWLVLLIAAALLAAPVSAGAAVVTPNTVTDEYDAAPPPGSACSLREAIKSADGDSDFGGCTHTGGAYNFDPGSDTVRVPTGVYTLTLTGSDESGGDLNTASTMSIEAAPGAAVTIDANDAHRVLFASINGVTLTLRGLTLTGGAAGPSTNGGAIFSSSGTGLVISDSTITDNSAGSSGGGIAANGPTSLTDTTISANQATQGGAGVALSSNGSLTASGATHIDGNTSGSTGGGISKTNDGDVTLNSGVTVDGNSAVGFGGGIYISGDATALTLDGASVSDNDLSEDTGLGIATGSGIYYLGADGVDIAGSEISGNDSVGDRAGPALTVSFSTAPISIDSTTIGGNTATGQDDADEDSLGPAGIFVNGDAITGGATITDSTVSANSVIGADLQDAIIGGGIYPLVPLTIERSSVALNTIAGGAASSRSGAGLFVELAPVDVLNSTFSGNNAGGGIGGAIELQVTGNLSIGQSTFSGNTAAQGSAINTQGAPVGSSTLTLLGSIFTEGATACSFGVGQTVVADSFNVDAGTSCVGAPDDSDFENTLASLSGLADNGGPTETMSLLGPPSLFNAGGDCTQLDGTTPLLVDQRGAPRPSEGACEPGAYERFFCGGVLFNGPGQIVCPPPPSTGGGGGSAAPSPPGSATKKKCKKKRKKHHAAAAKKKKCKKKKKK